MPEELAPGLFIEEVAPPRSIDGVATSTAAFLGHATAGPLDRAVLVTSFVEYERTFGGIADLRAIHAARPSRVPAVDRLGHAVFAFFANGGRRAFVRRLSTEGPDPLPVRDPAAFRAALDEIDDDPEAGQASVVLAPGFTWGVAGRPVLRVVAGHSERTRRRIALIDLPPRSGRTGAGSLSGLRLPTTSFAAAYHPWLVVTNPLGDPPTVRVPPSGFVAGLLARTDIERGVSKPPAGQGAVLRGALDVSVALDATALSALTRANVNSIRRFTSGSPVVWGARTLAAAAAPEWKYVNVRRLGLYLERSIDRGIQWAVFEPNAQPLWTELRREVENFMLQVWRDGALPGTRPEDAWFVHCGLGATMTQDDIDRGRVVVEVGFAPLRPAEFVFLRFMTAAGPPAA